MPEQSKKKLEDLASTLQYEFRSDFLRKLAAKNLAEGRAEGEADGRAMAVLAVLAAREIDVPDEVRERVLACTDLAELDTWVRRAATAVTAKDLFQA